MKKLRVNSMLCEYGTVDNYTSVVICVSGDGQFVVLSGSIWQHQWILWMALRKFFPFIFPKFLGNLLYLRYFILHCLIDFFLYFAFIFTNLVCCLYWNLKNFTLVQFCITIALIFYLFQPHGVISSDIILCLDLVIVLFYVGFN